MMDDPLYTNSLIRETSPYLLQHAHNPVMWYAYCDAAFEKAKAEDKLLVISIGYSACHWCHVMERECFDDEEVAMVMNDHFVSIKVDKEERPDVDQIYMSAVRVITGNGGWPLNVICLPDGRPIYGGAYFPKQQWMEILNKLNELYTADRERMVRVANDLAEGVRNIDLIKEKSQGLDYLPKYLRLIVEPWKRKFDAQWGGTKAAPKFPMPASLEFLLSYAYHMRDDEVAAHALLTLDKIYEGGIYDRVGGGFHRYSTDARWFLPHFEKMLYDNALLAQTYLHAFQLTKKDSYRQVVVGTLELLLHELYSNDKLFFSSVDADTAEGEGRFYMWSFDEVCTILDADAPLFCDRFGVSRKGNVEYNANILSVAMPIDELCRKYSLTREQATAKLDLSLRKLACARSLRDKPAVDTKYILAWNAMAVKAFAMASTVLDEPRYLVVALECIAQIERLLMRDGSLFRVLPTATRTINGLLDDYAYLTDAYLSLYSATFEEGYLHKADALVKKCLSDFFDHQSGMFFYSDKSSTLPLGRKMDVVDGVMPSANSVLARSMNMLSIAFDNAEYRRYALQMLSNMQEQMSGAGPFVANWGLLLINLTFAPVEVAIVGHEACAKRQELDKEYLPNVFIFGSEKPSSLPIFQNRWVDGLTAIHLCIDGCCHQFDGSINDLKGNALELRNCYIL